MTAENTSRPIEFGSQGHPNSESAPEQSAPVNLTSASQVRSLPHTFRSLRNRNFRLYWFGQMISVMGDSMQTIGQAWLVLQLTNSAWQLGLVSALQFVPTLLFSLFGGIFADRWPKRRVLLVTESADMCLALLLWALTATGTIQVWHIYVLALLFGLTNSLSQPTSSAFVVELVGRDDLPNAVALNSTRMNLARIVGPGLGGIIIAASSVTLLFLLNALSFLAVIAGLALIDGHALYAQAPRHTGAGERQSVWQSLREGMDYVWKTPAIVLIIVVVGLVLLFGENLHVVLPIFATDVLHVGSTGFGFLSAAMSAGALLASLWLAWSHLRPSIRRVLLATLAFGALEAAFAVSQNYLLSLLLIASIGATTAIFGALAITILQTVAPDHLRGRVISVYVLFFTGSLPLGSLLTGSLLTLCGPSTGLLICTSLCLLVAGAGWIYRKPAEHNLAESTHA
jgi:MFS family permease